MSDPASELLRINEEFIKAGQSQKNRDALKKRLYKWNNDYCEFRASSKKELKDKEAKIPLFIYKSGLNSWIVLSKLAYLNTKKQISIVLSPIIDINDNEKTIKMVDHALYPDFETTIPETNFGSIVDVKMHKLVNLKSTLPEIKNKIITMSFKEYVGKPIFKVNNPVYVGDWNDEFISPKVIAPNYSLLGVIDEVPEDTDTGFKIRVFMRGGLPSIETLVVPFWAHDNIVTTSAKFKIFKKRNPKQWSNVETSIKRLETFYFQVFKRPSQRIFLLSEEENIQINEFTKIEIVIDKLQLTEKIYISLDPKITNVVGFVPIDKPGTSFDDLAREHFLLSSKSSYLYGYGSVDKIEKITEEKSSIERLLSSTTVNQSGLENLLKRIDYILDNEGPVIEPVIEPEPEPEKEKEELKTLQKKITDLTKKNTDLEEKLNFAKLEVAQLKKDNKNLKSEIQKKDKKIKELEAKPEIPPAEAKQEKIAEIKRKLEKAKQELRRLNQEAYELKEARKDPKRKEKGELNLQTQIKIKLNDIGRLNYILLELTDSKKVLALPKTEIKSIETVIKQLSKNETIMKLNQLKQNLKSLNEKAFQQKRIDPNITTEEGTMFQSRIQTTIEEIEKLNKHLINLKKK